MKKLLLFCLGLFIVSAVSPFAFAEEKRNFQFEIAGRFLMNNGITMNDPNVTSINMNLNDIGAKFSIQYFIFSDIAIKGSFDLGEIRQETLLWGAALIDRTTINNRLGVTGKFYIDKYVYVGAGALKANIETPEYYNGIAFPRVEDGLAAVMDIGVEQILYENMFLSLSYQATFLFLNDKNKDFIQTDGTVFLGEASVGIGYRI